MLQVNVSQRDRSEICLLFELSTRKMQRNIPGGTSGAVVKLHCFGVIEVRPT
jgi:hypothetical protein